MEFPFMKKSLVCLSVLASFVGAAAHAEDAPAVTANLTVTTKYKYRGQDQSNVEKNVAPAVQGGFDFSYNGFYIGNWNSSIGLVPGTDIEMDFYGGYKGAIAPDFGFDVGVLRYQYPQGAPLNTTELYGALSWKFVTAKLSYNAGDRYFGLEEGRGTLYGDLTANYEVVKGVTLNGHVGYTALTSDTKALYPYKSYVELQGRRHLRLRFGLLRRGRLRGRHREGKLGRRQQGAPHRVCHEGDVRSGVAGWKSSGYQPRRIP
jgi:uncharacterized protein (TIGR02001 family)